MRAVTGPDKNGQVVREDLIVVGSRGLSDLKGMLIGNVSHKLIQLAKCTCIAVK